MTFDLETMSELADELAMTLTGVATPENPFNRRILWETLDDRLPRGAQARVRFHTVDMLPDSWSSWHIHNGPSYHLLLQGHVGLERVCDEPDAPSGRTPQVFKDEYKAGDAFAEPVGIPHRAGNLHRSLNAVVVTLHLAEVDRHHIVTLGYDRPDGSPA